VMISQVRVYTHVHKLTQ